MNSADEIYRMIVPLQHLFGIFNEYGQVATVKQTIQFNGVRSDNDFLLIEIPQFTVAGVVLEHIKPKFTHILPQC